MRFSQNYFIWKSLSENQSEVKEMRQKLISVMYSGKSELGISIVGRQFPRKEVMEQQNSEMIPHAHYLEGRLNRLEHAARSVRLQCWLSSY